jgi:hypothetical protein
MASTRLKLARSVFEKRIDAAEDYVNRCRKARHDSTNRLALTRDLTEWSAELALLKLVLGSERFFEITMALYVLGDRSPSGYRPRRLRKLDTTTRGVIAVFRGDQDHIGWNSPAAVIGRAERWMMAGEPFQTALASASQLLAYLVKMRNVVAHESDSAIDKYRNATRALYGGLPNRICPGAQLIGAPPTAIPYLAGASLLEAAIASYRLVAKGIVP